MVKASPMPAETEYLTQGDTDFAFFGQPCNGLLFRKLPQMSSPDEFGDEYS